MTGHDGFRRRLIAIAVRDYPQATDAFSAAIDAQVAVLANWLSNPALDGRSFKHDLLNPASRQEIEDFHKKRLTRLGPADVLVLYVTGHGVEGASGHHFLLQGNSDETHLLTTAFRTSSLVTAVLDSDAEHVLVLVDTCHAGALHAELALLTKELPVGRRKLPTLAVIASADFDEKPRIGDFARLLQLVYERLCGPAEITAPHLTYSEFLTEISAVRRQNRDIQGPTIVWLPDPSSPDQSLCLPNPGYRATTDIVAEPRRQLAATRSEIEHYWAPRAAGRVSMSDSGWYFSGRRDLNKAVASFLRSGTGLFVVTGAVGSGKSAVLARAVTLSDATFLDNNATVIDDLYPEETPPRGSIDAAVIARGKGPDQVCTELVEILGGTIGSEKLAPLDQLSKSLSAIGKTQTLVIDGIDEALYPARLITDVLVPLTRLTFRDGSLQVRMILGLRSTTKLDLVSDDVHPPDLLDLLRRTAAGTPVELQRTDEVLSVTSDIDAYVTSLLHDTYSDDPGRLSQIATIIAQNVTPSFLDARLAGERLRGAREPQDLNDRRWLSTLSNGTVSLFKADVAEVAAAIKRKDNHTLAVLRASAFSLGQGLPWSEVWPAAAGAVNGAPIAEPDNLISSILASRLSGYLTQDVVDGRVMHRPSHERLAEVLREQSGSLLALQPNEDEDEDITHIHEQIARKLAEIVDPSGVVPPHPYIRRYLVDHAQRGHALDDLHVPPHFLVWEQGSRVRSMLQLQPPSPTSTSHLAAWARIEPYLSNADITSRRVSYALTRAAIGLEPAPAEAALPLTAHMCAWSLPAGNVLTAINVPVRAMTMFGAGDGRSLLLTLGADEVIRSWDSETGISLGESLPTATRMRTFTPISSSVGPTILATSDTNGTVRFWDLDTKQAVGEPLPGRGFVQSVAAVPIIGGQTLLAAAYDNGTIRLWNPDTHETVEPTLPTRSPVLALTAISTPQGKTLLVTAFRSGTVLLWDIDTRETVGGPLPIRGGAVHSLTAVPQANGGSFLATGHDNGTIRLWDLDTRKIVDTPIPRHVSDIEALAAVPKIDGGALLATGHDDGTIRLWEPQRESSNADPLNRFHEPVAALAMLPHLHQPAELAVYYRNGDLQLWNTDTKATVGKPLRTTRNTTPSALTAYPRKRKVPLLAIGNNDGTIRLWDTETRRAVGSPFPSRRRGLSPVRALAAVELPDGQTMLAITRNEGAVQLWHPQSNPNDTIYLPGRGKVCSLASITQPDGLTRLATGHSNGTVRIWNPLTRKLIQTPITSQSESVEALTAIPLTDGRTVLATGQVDGTIKLWDLVTETEILRIATGHVISSLTTVNIGPRAGLAIGSSGGFIICAINEDAFR